MAKDLSSITEPPVDPLAVPAKGTTAAVVSPMKNTPPPAKLPAATLEMHPHYPRDANGKRYVPRKMFDVYAISAQHGGQAFGPIPQEAVDEPEAIQRVLDAGKIGGLDRAKCQFKAFPQKAAAATAAA